jgi:hypothetical protein
MARHARPFYALRENRPRNSLKAISGVARPQGKRLRILSTLGEFHDQGDAEWVMIRGPLRGHNDTPFGRPTPGRPIGHPGVGLPQGVLGGLNYH